MFLFVDAKFRQLMRVSELELKNYYENLFLPEARSRGLDPIPSEKDVEVLIQRNIVEEKVAAQMKNWLKQMRKTTAIEVLPPATPTLGSAR